MPRMIAGMRSDAAGTRGGVGQPPGGMGPRALGQAVGPKVILDCDLFGVKPEITFAMDRTIAVFFKRGWSVRFTSVVRPAGEKFSLHPEGYAFDCLGTFAINPEVWKSLVDEISLELPSAQYYLLVHDAGSGMHLHCEFDPPHNEKWQDYKSALRAAHSKTHPPRVPGDEA